MNIPDILGHTFYFFIFLGMLSISRKEISGWWLRIAGNLGWIGLGLKLEMSSIYLWGLIFVFIDFVGLIGWTIDENRKR